MRQLGSKGGGGSFPMGAPLYDFVFDVNRIDWELWSARVPDYVQPSPFHFYEIMVPTTDSVLYTYLLGKLAQARPILLVGESGTAKTLTIQNYMSSLDRDKNVLLTLNLSSRTTSNDVQVNLEANIDKRSGAIYGPQAGKRLCVFIDDLNMPKLDKYGTQQPLTWIQTLMSRGFFYDRGKDLNQKIIKDLDYIAAMGPPGGGRNPITPRIYALFNVVNLTDPSSACLTGIVTAILNARFDPFPQDAKDAVTKIPEALLKVQNAVTFLHAKHLIDFVDAFFHLLIWHF